MPIYEWACRECKLYWERECRLGKAPDRTRCPECNKLSGRKWDVAPPVHFKGGRGAGWHTKGGGELDGSSDVLNKAMQEGTKKRIEKGYEAYKVYSPSEGYIKATGARRMSDEEVVKKLDASKKASAEVYDKAGIDPYNKYKPQ